jgi:hypothetical protein
MIELILFNWATYLFLLWLTVILVVNFWPTKKPASPPEAARFTPTRVEGEFPAASFEEERELVHRKR